MNTFEATSHYQAGTRDCPEVYCVISHEEIALHLLGESSMENAFGWYEPLENWLKNALSMPQTIPFRLHLDVRYCNTASQKSLLNLVDMLFQHYRNSERSVHATYKVHEEDDDLLEMVHELFEEWDAECYTIERYA